MAYENEFSHELPRVDGSGKTIPILLCICGKAPMGTDSANKREVLRLCAGCFGIVNVPLHGLDGVSHLACPVGGPSTALLDANGLLTTSVRGELVGIGTEECFAHPVRTVAQRLVKVQPQAPSGSEWVPKQPIQGGGAPIEKRRSFNGMNRRSFPGPETRIGLPSSRRSDEFHDMGAFRQQRPAPVANMGGSTAGQDDGDGESVRGQLNQNFKVP